MTPASKQSHARMAVGAAFVLAIVFVIGPVGALVSRRFGSTAGGGILVGLFVLCTTGFFWAIFFWRPRCPQCGSRRARFTYDGNDLEYLDCPRCGFKAATGYDRRNMPS